VCAVSSFANLWGISLSASQKVLVLGDEVDLSYWKQDALEYWFHIFGDTANT
jgi:hypothetical protein